jgi:tripartite ATP-independent transporter DctP family solute receptor
MLAKASLPARAAMVTGLVSVLCVWAVATAQTPAPATFKLRYAHNHATTTPQHKAIELFAKLVEERSKGAIQVAIFPASQLGGNREQTEAVGLGTVDFTQQPTSVAAIYAPQMVAIDLPYLFASEDVALKALNGPVGTDLLKTLERKGIRGMGFWPTGFSEIFTSTKPIRSPDDLKGMKMRVLPSPLLIATFKAWGASPTTIDYKEVYTALQQKVVDGWDSPLIAVPQLKIWEVQKYVTLTQYRLFSYVTMVSKQTFDSLPAPLQQVVLQADRDAQTEYLKLFHAQDADAAKMAQEKGMTVITLTAEQKEAFKKASEPVYEQFADQIGRELLKRVRDAGRAG